MPLAEERTLVERLKRGDRASAGALYQWYGDRLFRQVILPRLPIPELAEDVLKDTFRITLEKIEQYKPEGTTSIFFWMRRIAINRAMDVHRAHDRSRKLEDRQEEAATRSMSEPPPAPDREPESAETRAQVELSLTRMNERYALALRLRLLEDRDREECAALLGVNVGNFDVIFHRACKAFRQVYPP
jgi:RNA polymerase sigma-70 factor (ECF subfamily)